MSSTSVAPATADRLSAYERRTAVPLLVLAVCFVVTYAIPIVHTDLGGRARAAVGVANWAIWAVFAVDLGMRVRLSPSRWRYLWSHPVDVLMVVLPVLRPLRVLRVFTIGQVLVSRADDFSFRRATQAICAAAAFLVLIAGLAELDAEQSAPNANIRTLPDALWWAATTVTTVGYGDRYPVTTDGRLVAVALMLLGIALVGTITAAVASWFLAQTQGASQAEERQLRDRIIELEQRVDAGFVELRDLLERRTDSPGRRPGAEPRADR